MVAAHGRRVAGRGRECYRRGEVQGEQCSSPFVSEHAFTPCFGPSPGGVGRL